MDLLLEADDYEGAAYFLQQSLEKFLKAWLLGHGLGLSKTHELANLLHEAADSNPVLDRHRPLCYRVAGYYFSQRYPTLTPALLTRAELEEDIRGAAELLVDLEFSP